MNQKLGTVITQTPFRINFFGGGSDFPFYFNRHRGAVLGTTINKYLYVTVNSLERLLEKRIRLSYSKLEQTDEPEQIKHDVVRQVLINHRSMLNGGFLDIHSFADLPFHSGVGSSSAFAVGLLNALYLLHKIYHSPMEIAKEAIQIEREQLGLEGGWQDQIHAAYGGFNRIDFSNNQFTVTPICLPEDRLKSLESSCMFFFTGLTRDSSEVQRSVLQNSSKGESHDQYFHAMVKMVDEGLQILRESSKSKKMVQDIGSLLDRAWKVKKELSDSVSNSTIDEAYAAALKAGAYGGKLLGAGGGGFLVLIAPLEAQDEIASTLGSFRRIHVEFDSGASRAVFANR